MVGPHEHSNEPLGAIEGGKFLDQVSDHQLLHVIPYALNLKLWRLLRRHYPDVLIPNIPSAYLHVLLCIVFGVMLCCCLWS